MTRKRILILGAAGRDFHNFNMAFRKDRRCEVVAFTAAQIPRISGRIYPPSLSGPLYPNGVPILDEADLEKIIAERGVQSAVMAYSDLSYNYVMHLGARVNAAGADFVMMGTNSTFLKSKKPVIAVTAVRTGSGKSQISRFIAARLRQTGIKVVSVRHPMPYGDLESQTVQRIASFEDLDRYNCTIEEREEYEKHIEENGVVYAGVDYRKILKQAEKEADVVIWDGGNNDTPFYKPDCWIVVADPLRPGHEDSYFPGETNVRAADVVVIGKVNAASPDAVARVEENCRRMNPRARIVKAASVLSVDRPDLVRAKRVLVIEDGPTLTHGEMKFGAGTVAAQENGASEIVDPRRWAVGGIADTFKKYPGIGKVLPAMGYWGDQIADLEKTIAKVECDTVVIATPFDLRRILKIDKPCATVTYRHEDVESQDGLADVVDDFLKIHAR